MCIVAVLMAAAFHYLATLSLGTCVCVFKVYIRSTFRTLSLCVGSVFASPQLYSNACYTSLFFGAKRRHTALYIYARFIVYSGIANPRCVRSATPTYSHLSISDAVYTWTMDPLAL